MKKVDWIEPSGIYIISGGASANSLFFEDKQSHTIFFNYFNRFMGGMCDVLNYKLNETGWAFLIHVKDDVKVRDSYFKQREKSKKAKSESTRTESFRMFSDHMRYFLSNFVNASNLRLHRSGGLVKKRFEKTKVGRHEDYDAAFQQICRIKECLYKQELPKYQPDYGDYKMGESINKMDAWVSAIGMYEGRMKNWEMPIDVKIVRPKSNVLRQIYKNLKTPEILNSNPNPPP